MANLLWKVVVGGGQYRSDSDSMYLRSPNVVQELDSKHLATLEFESSPDPDTLRLDAFTVSGATMDLIEPGAVQSGFPAESEVSASLNIGSDPESYRAIQYSYIPGNEGRVNKELGISTDIDTMLIQWPGLLGSIEEFGIKRLMVSTSISVLVEQGGDNGGLEPDDPIDIPDDPVDPGENPDILVVGGLEEVSVTVNPNSVYSIHLVASKGVEITGVTGLDRTMSWDAYTKTLTGSVLGPTPKKVMVQLGAQEAALIIKAEPVSKHII